MEILKSVQDVVSYLLVARKRRREQKRSPKHAQKRESHNAKTQNVALTLKIKKVKLPSQERRNRVTRKRTASMVTQKVQSK